ncbi:MAG: hypothetical protein AAFV25_17900 [Bacteroidota bacterium]
MIYRAIFFLFIIGLVLFLIRIAVLLLQSKDCKHCDGQGHWKGTRGDRNVCKVCNGSGQL